MRVKFFERRKKENGQALLEFALVLPILFLLVFGAVDLGRVFFAQIALTNAAREGVRYLTINPKDVSNAAGIFKSTIDATVQEAGFSGIVVPRNQVTVACTNRDDDPEHCDSGLPATVTVTYNFNLILGWILPTPITLTRSAVMVVP
ncbi:MAG TPA: hypothetical protein DEH25_12900 [Chloroflexi bacterium]|nr:hypothetical protein [Chloroflexota bacterium]